MAPDRSPYRSHVARNSRQQTFARFVMVSAGTFVTGQLILYWIHSIVGVAPVPANVASTAANTAIVLAANRRWVWRVNGAVNLRRELAPFAAIAAAGLLVSTVLVAVVARFIGDGLWVNAANMTGFALLWVLRFVLIDRYVYPKPRGLDVAPRNQDHRDP